MITNFDNFNKKLFYTKKSDISGFGNFANVDLKSDINLGVGLEKIDDTGDPDNDYKRFDICTYTNHSDNPNLNFKKEGNIYYFYTLMNINKDEELTIDYSKFDFEGERDFI